MNKFVLDTNILLEEPNFLSHFSNSTVILPIDIFQELDKFKKAQGELGANARLVARELDKHSVHPDVLTSGAPCGSNTVLFSSSNEWLDGFLEKNKLENNVDNRIIATAKLFEASIISNDLLLRVKARALGIKADEFQARTDINNISDIYTGFVDLTISQEDINKLHSDGLLPYRNIFHNNQYIKLQSEVNSNQTALGKWNGLAIQRLVAAKSVFGIRPKNLEQVFAFDALLDPSIELVTMLGRAGTGKTLLCLAAALEQVLEDRTYNRIILMRSPIPVGRDIGWLPGDIMSKIMPYFQAYIDNMEIIFGSRKENGPKVDDLVNNMLDSGQLEFVPPTFMRGRSIPKSIIVVDEAQNMTRHEIKTIATRMGEGSKLIVMGDLHQIDNNLDALDNGFVHLMEGFKGEMCAAHVSLHKCERSSFADLAAERL